MKSALIAALLAAAPAEQAQRPCFTEAQVEDLTLFALPPLLEAAASRCAPHLPTDAYLLNGGRALSRQLAAGSSERWPGASSALAVFAEDKFPQGLSEPTARGLVHDLAASELLGKVKPEQCVRLNRLADLLSPLPPANLSGVIVLLAQLASVGDGKKKGRPSLLCSPAQP